MDNFFIVIIENKKYIRTKVNNLFMWEKNLSIPHEKNVFAGKSCYFGRKGKMYGEIVF